jgi:hypothetical protein
MSLSPRRGLRAAGVLLATALTVPASAATPDAASLARLTFVEHGVETGVASWEQAVEGRGFDIGQRLRTGPEGVARLDLPWMVLSVGPGSELRFPDEHLLAVVVERGRVVLDARTHEALKLVTAEGEVRGLGRAIVRREDQRTIVTCVEGRFEVLASGRGVSLVPGSGTVVSSGRPPTAPADTPPPPGEESLWPGRDPVFTARGEPLDLRWEATAPSYHLEILPVGADTVLLERDVGPPPVPLSLPWGGAFRWRVAARDERGLEGLPSTEGLICVDLVD